MRSLNFIFLWLSVLLTSFVDLERNVYARVVESDILQVGRAVLEALVALFHVLHVEEGHVSQAQRRTIHVGGNCVLRRSYQTLQCVWKAI